jgi:pimeloyl-ACP methyl ester carboxylesterase
MHVEERGSGSAVVLLHGSPTAVTDFQPLATALATRHRVLVPHLPGYGETAAAPTPYRLDDVIERLEQRLLDAGVSRAAFVALSGGAYKAVALALRDRIQVSRLALLAPVVGMDGASAQGFRDVVAAMRAGAFDPRPSWLDRMASPGLAQRDPAAAAKVSAWLNEAPLAVICDELAAAADATDLRPRLHELACPVLVCAGTADAAVPAAWAEDVVGRVRDGALEWIEGAGHALLIEAPARMSTLLTSFLARDASPSSAG